MRIILCSAMLLALVFAVAGDSDSTMPQMEFEQHFYNLPEKRHPFYMNGSPWVSGRKYIQEVFHRYGCRDLREQKFNTTVSGQTVQGINIVCVVEGLNKTAPMIVVGADYSTNKVANQMRDNTGGVASLLEVMHLFFDRIYWNNYDLERTVVFVAFDLNTREYHESALGQPGSYYFVHHWLAPFLHNLGKNQKREFQGAIILDSITTFNVANNTQNLADGFEKAMPKAYNEITASGMKGDFIGFLYTAKEKDNAIVKTLPPQWNKDRKRRPFRLQEMNTTLSFDTLGDDFFKRIDHQAHYHFWTYLDNPLPAFLLFDTDNDRTEAEPCHIATNCSVEEFLTKDKIQFLTKITDTVMNTIMDLQTKYYKSGSAATHSPLIMSFVSIAFLAGLPSLIMSRI